MKKKKVPLTVHGRKDYEEVAVISSVEEC